MSETKELGVIGQVYEDRNTGKLGTLDSRDEKCKTLMMLDEEGKGFSISYSSFRSRWRKYADAEPTDVVPTDSVSEVVTAEPEIEEEEKPIASVIEEFNSKNKKVQLIQDDTGYHFEKENFNVCSFKFNKDGTYSMMCFPDVYTDSVELRQNSDNFKCSRTQSGLDVKILVNKVSFEKLVNMVKDAIVHLNLYGYVME